MSLGKVPGKMVGASNTGAEGNHDNPVSGNHQAPSHWQKTVEPWYLPHTYRKKGEGRAGSKVAKHRRKGKSARANELTSKPEL